MTSIELNHKNNDVRPRSWSMLDVREMEMIHALADDIQSSYLSENAGSTSMSTELKSQNLEPLSPNDESDYLFHDVIQDVSIDENKSMNHNYDNILKFGKIQRANSFACGGGSHWARELDTARHIHQALNLEQQNSSESDGEVNSSVHEHNESLLSEYQRIRKSQPSPDNAFELMVTEKEENHRKIQTNYEFNPVNHDRSFPFVDASRDVESVAPTIKMPALLAPKTISTLKPVMKLKLEPQSVLSNNVDLDSSNGSLSSSVASHEGKPKGILKKSSSIGRLQTLPSDTDSPNALGREGMKRTASFSTLEIRSYSITLGDNPGGSHGAPVSLGWDYNPVDTVNIDLESYEKNRPKRRARSEMYMSGSIRMFLLMKSQGYSLHDIEAAAKEAEKLRKQRLKTVKKEQLKQSIGRIFGRSK